MVFKEVKKLLSEKLMASTEGFGFELSSFNKQGFMLTHKTKYVLLEIAFGSYDRSDGYEFSGGGMSILFYDVERIVFPLIIKHQLWDTASEPTAYSLTLGSYNLGADLVACRQSLASVHIDSMIDVENYMALFREYFERFVLPWFEKYSRLDAVNEFINSVGMQDILNSFAAPFPTHFYRAMVIADKCSNRTRTLEIRDECLRRFEECKTDSFYSKEMIASYYSSLTDLCGQLGL